jgi:hypothetical protein
MVCKRKVCRVQNQKPGATGEVVFEDEKPSWNERVVVREPSKKNLRKLQ